MAARRTRKITLPEVRATARPAADVVIEEITTAAGRDAFIRFQLDHYRGDELFVPPIAAERRDFLDPKVNPFFREATVALFVARRRGTIVGRIAAVVDSRSNRFHQSADGFFGLFEAQNDPGIAAALFQAASTWLRARAMKRLVGPINLAFHHEAGLLVQGFETAPAMMMTYNPPTYPALIEACGFSKFKDLYSYELSASQGMPQQVVRLADRVRAQGQVRVRRLNTRDPENDIRRIKAIYESMLKPGFGFAPISDAEFEQAIQRLRPVVLLRPEMSLIAEIGDEAVAFGITLPDTNLAVKAANGFLFPLGIAKMLWAARSIDRLRVLLFGIKDGYRRRGIDALLAHETYKEAVRLGYSGGQLGWVMEDDRLVNRMIEATGARRSHVFRLYELAL